MRWRSCRLRMPIAVSNSSSSSVWNSSSRGKVSRMWSRALPSWLVGDRAGALDDAPDFVPQQRDRPRTAAVGERGEQAEEQPDADDFAGRSEPAHADRIHVGGAVNGGAPVRLGDDQQLAAADEILHIGRQRGEVAQPAENRIASSRRMPSGPRSGLAAPANKYSRKPRKVKLSSSSQRRKSCASARSAAGTGGRRLRGQFARDLTEHLAHRLPVPTAARTSSRTAARVYGSGDARPAGSDFAGDLDLHP